LNNFRFVYFRRFLCFCHFDEGEIWKAQSIDFSFVEMTKVIKISLSALALSTQ